MDPRSDLLLESRHHARDSTILRCVPSLRLAAHPFSKSVHGKGRPNDSVSTLIPSVSILELSPLTSSVIFSLSEVPNAFCRSSCGATWPFETLMKTFSICTTSSRSFSLDRSRKIDPSQTTRPGCATIKLSVNLHACSPFANLILVACDLEALAPLLVPDHRDVGELDLVCRLVDRHLVLQVSDACGEQEGSSLRNILNIEHWTPGGRPPGCRIPA